MAGNPFRQTAIDWKAKVYVDAGGGMGLAGYVCHIGFTSASLKQSIHGIYFGAGAGINASVDLNGLWKAAEKVLGLGDVIPSVGQDLKTMCMRPFAGSDLAVCTGSVVNAGVAAIAAPADCKVIQLGNFCQMVEAKATVKPAIAVGSSWTAGNFIAVWSNGERPEWPTVTAERHRKKASDPMYFGAMKM